MRSVLGTTISAVGGWNPSGPALKHGGAPCNPRESPPVRGKPVLTFDTSAINRLADDPERRLLEAGIAAGFWFRLTGDALGEVVAATGSARRKVLLDLAKFLLLAGDCLLPHDELLRRVATQHAGGGEFDWKAVSVRCQEYEEEIRRQEFINDDIADVQRRFAGEVGNEFARIYGDARPKFQGLFRRNGSAPPSLSDLIEALQRPAGAFWSIAAVLYSKPTGVTLNEAATRDFVDTCPPFRALLISLCIAQHQRAIQNPQEKSTGAFDLYMSVYLPYCEQFVTADPRQEAALLQVASLGKLTVGVCSYTDFRARLLGPLGAKK